MPYFAGPPAELNNVSLETADAEPATFQQLHLIKYVVDAQGPELATGHASTLPLGQTTMIRSRSAYAILPPCRDCQPTPSCAQNIYMSPVSMQATSRLLVRSIRT